MTEITFEQKVQNAGLNKLNIGDLFNNRTPEERRVIGEKMIGLFPQIPLEKAEARFLFGYVISKIKMEQKDYYQALAFNQTSINVIPKIMGENLDMNPEQRKDIIECLYKDYGIIYRDRVTEQEALDVFNKGLIYLPNNPVLREHRAYLYYLKGNLASAYGEFTKLINEGSKEVCVYIARGFISIAQNDKAGAQADLTAARQLEPDNAFVAYYQGYIDREVEIGHKYSRSAVRRFFSARQNR